MAFEFVNVGAQRDEPYITLDKYRRIRVSAKARDQLNINATLAPYVAVAYDPEAQAIALQKAELVSQLPAKAVAKLDGRNYLRVSEFVRDYGIDFADGKPKVYRYNGDIRLGGQTMLSFRLVD